MSVNVRSDLGTISFLLIYCPPSVHTDYDDWLTIFDLVNLHPYPIICGDFNAHHESWGAMRSEPRGRYLSSVAADQGSVVLNYSLPTFSPFDRRQQSYLDLIFNLSEIHHLFTLEVTGDHFGSDHVLITSSLSCEPSYCRASSIRYNVQNVGWSSFRFCLRLFNSFFMNSLFPEAWRKTRVIFIPKPGGKGFRPISLTSVLSKLMERIIHRRLEHFVDQSCCCFSYREKGTIFLEC